MRYAIEISCYMRVTYISYIQDLQEPRPRREWWRARARARFFPGQIVGFYSAHGKQFCPIINRAIVGGHAERRPSLYTPPDFLSIYICLCVYVYICVLALLGRGKERERKRASLRVPAAHFIRGNGNQIEASLLLLLLLLLFFSSRLIVFDTSRKYYIHY